jgi:hypothetical protein
MKIYPLLFLAFTLLTCHNESDGKDKKENPLGCFAQDVPEGVELVCDGVPHLIKNGKDGAQGAAGHNGGPGPKGDQGPPGSGGRSIDTIILCHTHWEGVPAYDLDYNLFTYSDGVKEVTASFQTDKNELSVNSAIWIKDDPRYDQSPVDVGGFSFTKVSDGAVVLYQGNGRTSEMTCR